MIKYFCDICRAELDTDNIKTAYLNQKTIGLCEECEKLLLAKFEELQNENKK